MGDAARQLCIANGHDVYGTTRSVDKVDKLNTKESTVFHIQEGIFPSEMVMWM